MNWIKKISVSFIYSIGLLLLLTFVLTFFNYINFINKGFFTFFEIFNLIISVFVGGFLIGKKSFRKGWLEGIKFGLFFIILMFFVNYFVFSMNVSFKFAFFNIIILVVAMFGGMVGICFRKEKNSIH